ncbi:hypothetical protein IP70_16475 [alpha proteobacterium AAP38]|nr:hypothetical protein IP70_16475 [alpha proteobacterium AAP38]
MQGQIMKFRFAVALMLLAASPSFAEENPGYTKQQLSAFAVLGLKPGMTESQAVKILKENGYTGKLPALTQDFEEETTGLVKGKDDSERVFLFRYRQASSSDPLIYRIVFEQHFSSPQSIEFLSGKIMEKYGTPTEIYNSNSGPDRRTMYWRTEYVMSRTKIEECRRKSFELNCKQAKKNGANFVELLEGLNFEATVWNKKLELVINDQSSMKEEVKKVQDMRENKKEEENKKNSEKTKLGF